MRMRNHLKKLSVAVAVAMTVSTMSGVALAEPAAPAANSDSNTVAPAPETAPKPEGKPDSNTSPELPVPPEGVFVANYELRNAAGNLGNLVRDKNNAVIPTGSLKVTVVDQRLVGKAFDASKVRLMPQNGQSFSAIEGRVIPVNETTYDVVFDGLQYLGGDNTFRFDLSYSSEYALPVSSLSVALPQCYTIEKGGNESGDKLRAPNLIVKDFNFGGASVPAGSPFTLNLTIFTTSGGQKLSDVTVSLALPEHVTMANGNSSVYIGTMGPESSKQISFEILPSANLTGGVAALQLSMQGVGAADGAKVEGAGSVTVPVVQPERFEITRVQGAETLMVGEDSSLEITFVNKGKEPISNLSAEISGDNLKNPGQNQYLGNVQPGTQNTAEFTISAEKEGTLSGVITLTYENSAGQTKTLTKEYSCTVQEMSMDISGNKGMDMMPEEMPQPSQGMPVWAWVLIVIGVLAVGGAVTAVILKEQKAKKLAQLEAEDEDEDI